MARDDAAARPDDDEITEAEPGRIAAFQRRIARELDRLLSLRGDAGEAEARDRRAGR